MRNCRQRTLRRLALHCITVLLCASGFAISRTQAGPITFHFDATISQVQGDPVPLNLPFAVGQRLTATYTFGDLQSLLNVFTSLALGSHGDVAFTIGGAQGTATTNFGLINSSGAIGIPGPNSSIGFGYFSLTDVFPGWNGGIAGHQANIDLTFLGDEGLVSDVTDILHQETWDQMTKLRNLSVDFGYFDHGDFKIVTFLANATQAVVTPEPSGVSMIMLLVGNGLRRGRRRFRPLEAATLVSRSTQTKISSNPSSRPVAD
jgi:hypothetical protein